MRYGNTFRHLKRGITVGLLIGIVAYGIGALMFLFVKHLPVERLVPLTFIIAVPTLAIGIAVAPTLMFSIHIAGEWVEHRFLNRYVISRARVRDYQAMESPSGLFAATLRFADGTLIRIWGTHLGILAQLQRDLEEQAHTRGEPGAAPNDDHATRLDNSSGLEGRHR
jgi:hypothetical protein